jgi:hypothetical protein
MGAAPAWTAKVDHRGVDRLSVELPAAPEPRRGFYGACSGKEVDHGSACCPDRKPRANSFALYLVDLSKRRAVRSSSFSCAAGYLKSAISPSPSLFSTCPARPITAFGRRLRGPAAFLTELS